MQGRIVYPTTSGDINHHCERLLASGCTAIGMDTEWRVTYRANEAPRKTALLQVGSGVVAGQCQTQTLTRRKHHLCPNTCLMIFVAPQ